MTDHTAPSAADFTHDELIAIMDSLRIACAQQFGRPWADGAAVSALSKVNAAVAPVIGQVA